MGREVGWGVRWDGEGGRVGREVGWGVRWDGEGGGVGSEVGTKWAGGIWHSCH